MIKLCFQIDSIETLNFHKDSSLSLAREAQKRGYKIFSYRPKDLFILDGRVMSRLRPLTINADGYELGKEITLSLNEMDVILLRQNPPLDMDYITSTYILDMVSKDVLILNNPKSVRDCSEKLFACHYHQFMAPTLVTNSDKDILAFLDKHQKIVMKSLYGCAGQDIFLLQKEDPNLDSIISLFRKNYPGHIMVQKYLEEVIGGDKRILMIDGEIVGAVNRIPQEGKIISNIVAGGRGEKTVLTSREREICAAISPYLKEKGLFLVGLDIIAGYLTEINLTSPSCIVEINLLEKISLDAIFWDLVEKKLSIIR